VWLYCEDGGSVLCGVWVWLYCEDEGSVLCGV
jgi:hypothetical protein